MLFILVCNCVNFMPKLHTLALRPCVPSGNMEEGGFVACVTKSIQAPAVNQCLYMIWTVYLDPLLSKVKAEGPHQCQRIVLVT